jgi:broad specificity phosphatase PhoE
MPFTNNPARPAGRKPSRLLLLVCTLLAAFVCAPVTSADEAGQALWDKLRAGTHFAIMRHALAPGLGDPDNFSLGDCATQRNLSDEGREQARRIGARFRDNGIDRAALYSSQWCRCSETAELLGLGKVQELPALNSFFRRFEREEAQMRELGQWLAATDPDAPLVLVTHQVVITSLTGVFPQSGEVVVVRRTDSGDFQVAGTIRTE